ncbi:hypothetical protein OA93_09800 [Flavobacterium sp. KMS]|nr:hypothetical protein OA93_09800 [Flavobacterium sp. KMS]
MSSLLSGLIAIDFARVGSVLIKFIVLSVVTFYYWKLSRITDEINFKKIRTSSFANHSRGFAY